MTEKNDHTAPDTACPYIIGEDGLARWPDTHADAWIGLIETEKGLTRALDAELEAKHGLRLSAAEALGRLAAAPDARLGLSKLAAECGLSLSRISRIIDALEHRGLVERRTCLQRRPLHRSPPHRCGVRIHTADAGHPCGLCAGAFLRPAQLR